jgi:PPOX class probable F420-dependent enzyme
MLSDQLINARYINLATRKKDGNLVKTPVWAGHDDQYLYLFSAGQAGKVKRIRNFEDVEVAPCTVTGTITGDWHQGKASILSDKDQIKHASYCLKQKYGWQMHSLNFLSRLSGKINKRAWIRISIT